MANSIHIKLEYPEAASMKRDALLFEASLIKAMEHIRSYDLLRKKEFLLKAQIKKDLVMLKSLVSSVESNLPKEEIREVSEGDKIEDIKKRVKADVETRKVKKKLRDNKMDDLEYQLEDIKDKLARLG